jgi:hypothetical protein
MDAADEGGTPILEVFKRAIKLVEGANGEKLDEVHSSGTAGREHIPGLRKVAVEVPLLGRGREGRIWIVFVVRVRAVSATPPAITVTVGRLVPVAVPIPGRTALVPAMLPMILSVSSMLPMILCVRVKTLTMRGRDVL